MLAIQRIQWTIETFDGLNANMENHEMVSLWPKHSVPSATN